MERMSAPETGELVLTPSIPFIDIATPRAGPAGVAWVHEHNRNPCLLGFIPDKRPQLPEAPTGMLVALAFANRYPAANVRQLFEHQRGLRVFGIRHKLFRNAIIGPPPKAAFPSCQLFQPTLGRFRARRLIGLAMGHTPLANTFYLCPRGRMAIRSPSPD
jgi:hypothetical protein